MTVIEAILNVLREAGKPLHYREITNRIIVGRLYSFGGPTPEATVNAQINTLIGRRGEFSPIRRSDRGTYEFIDYNVVAESIPYERENSPTSARYLSFLDAAEKVLQSSPQPIAMHYRDITRRALKSGLIRTEGRTPEISMYAQIRNDIKRRALRGDVPRFVAHGQGLVSLARAPEPGLTRQIDQHNLRVREELRQWLYTMPPAAFEELVSELLVALGFAEVTVTARSGDGGIDVRGALVVGDVIRTQLAVQVKRWRTNVQAQIVQQVRGSLGTHEQGLIITTSDFSRGARQEAARVNAVPVGLMSGDQLVTLLVEHQIGVRRHEYYLIQLDDGGEEAPSN